MARIIGTPGESAGLRGARLLIGVPAIAVVFVGIPSLWALSYSSDRWGIAGLVFMSLAIGAVWFVQRDQWPDVAEVLREGLNYVKGLRGEVLVHQELKKLPDDYIVFHDFHPVDSIGNRARWNVDHIVVGPTGVFVLDAKYYRQASVQPTEKNKYSRKNVRQVDRNAQELKQRLVRWSAGELDKLFVVGVVVYTQPEAFVVQQREGHVRVLPLRFLVQDIRSHREQEIDPERAGRIARVLHGQLEESIRYNRAFLDEMKAYGEISKRAKREQVQARLATAGEPETRVPAAVPTACPWCQGRLVERTAKKGPRAGKKFLGCENWKPTGGCQYKHNLEE